MPLLTIPYHLAAVIKASIEVCSEEPLATAIRPQRSVELEVGAAAAQEVAKEIVMVETRQISKSLRLLPQKSTPLMASKSPNDQATDRISKIMNRRSIQQTKKGSKQAMTSSYSRVLMTTLQLMASKVSQRLPMMSLCSMRLPETLNSTSQSSMLTLAVKRRKTVVGLTKAHLRRKVETLTQRS